MLGIKTRLAQLYREYVMSNLVNPKQRYKCLRKLGYSVASNTILCPFKVTGQQLIIKDHVFINDWVYLDAAGGTITLEENVHLAQRVTVLTSSHSIGKRSELRCASLRQVLQL